MKKEFEVVSQETFKYLHLFLVQMVSRTPHIHKEIELGLVLNGRLTVREGRREWQLEAGEIYLINSMEVHEFDADSTDTLILAIQVSSKLLIPFLSDAALMRYQTEPPIAAHFTKYPNDYFELKKACLELAVHYQGRQKGYELQCFFLTARIFLLLGQKITWDTISQRNYDAAKFRMERMIRITDYIDHNFQRKLLLEEIAEMNGLTLTYVSHLFRDTLGITFQNYLKEKRLEHALSLIANTDRTILDITIESGFSDERYLNTLFRERMGCSPKEYRRRLSPINKNESASFSSKQRILNREESMARLSEYMLDSTHQAIDS